jgi:hypothetical protein
MTVGAPFLFRRCSRSHMVGHTLVTIYHGAHRLYQEPFYLILAPEEPSYLTKFQPRPLNTSFAAMQKPCAQVFQVSPSLCTFSLPCPFHQFSILKCPLISYIRLVSLCSRCFGYLGSPHVIGLVDLNGRLASRCALWQPCSLRLEF